MAKTHGLSNELWYSSYRSMMDRCYRRKAGNYKYYGAKGVTVCPEWHDAKTFGRWATMSGHKDGLTLDRVDAFANYSPDNCRWVNMKKQCNNRKNTIVIKQADGLFTISSLAKRRGITRKAISCRVFRGYYGSNVLHIFDLTRTERRTICLDL